MVHRRALLKGAIAASVSFALARRAGQSQESDAYSYPIGLAGRTMGDGYYIRHAFTSENTWYLPGHWHTGED